LLFIKVSKKKLVNSKCDFITEAMRPPIEIGHILEKAQSKEELGESGGIAPPILTSNLDIGKWLASSFGRFTLGRRASDTD
jgi:hypothetical protein